MSPFPCQRSAFMDDLPVYGVKGQAFASACFRRGKDF
jgi:hypothetical protein